MELNREGEVVVVTGSSGCLGHQTVKLLVSRDAKVSEIRCLDLVEAPKSMRDELDEELKRASEANPSLRKRIRFVRGDIRDINIVEQLLDGAHCVIHCAGRQEFWLEPSHQDQHELESVNVVGTENLLKSCIRLGVPKFVHVSSFETFVSYHTIYYATESTIPETRRLLFGPSAHTKREAENKVRQYANVKLKNLNNERPQRRGQQLDSLRAVIVRFTPIYGEHDRHFVSRLLQVAKFFGGKLQRFTNVWIRQQPIYVGNAAWSLISANRKLDSDETISGEEFHITDDTAIGDPFDFMRPFVECRGMKVSESSISAWPIWLLLVFFAFMRRCLSSLDFFGLFTTKNSRLTEAMKMDEQRRRTSQTNDSTRHHLDGSEPKTKSFTDEATKLRWYQLVTPQAFYFICNSLFLNRTKASLRLDYEPAFGPEESLNRALSWYKNHLDL